MGRWLSELRYTLAIMKDHEIEIRVRYPECDPMGFAHHGMFATWFEMGRSEMFRQGGTSYKDLEEAGRFLPVVEINIRYRKPARYDDILRLVSTVSDVTRAKIVFEYKLYRDDELLTTGQTVNACIDSEGQLCPIPAVIHDTFQDESLPKG